MKNRNSKLPIEEILTIEDIKHFFEKTETQPPPQFPISYPFAIEDDGETLSIKDLIL